MFVSSHICMIAVRSFSSNALIIAIYLPKFPLVCHFNIKIIALFFTGFHKIYTFLYIAARGAGKYFGAKFGAKTMKMPDAVQKYLGLTLLPHSGVSLVLPESPVLL